MKTILETKTTMDYVRWWCIFRNIVFKSFGMRRRRNIWQMLQIIKLIKILHEYWSTFTENNFHLVEHRGMIKKLNYFAQRCFM